MQLVDRNSSFETRKLGVPSAISALYNRYRQRSGDVVDVIKRERKGKLSFRIGEESCLVKKGIVGPRRLVVTYHPDLAKSFERNRKLSNRIPIHGVPSCSRN